MLGLAACTGDAGASAAAKPSSALSAAISCAGDGQRANA